MRKFLPALIIPILLILLIFFGKWGNPDGGFQFIKPPGYKDEAPSAGASQQFRRETPNGAIGCSLSSQLNPVFYITWNSFLDDAGEKVMNKIGRQLQDQLPGTVILNHAIIKSGELPILTYLYSIPDKPNGQRVGTGHALFFIAGATQYNLVCAAPLADDAQASADMNAMLRSFKFKL